MNGELDFAFVYIVVVLAGLLELHLMVSDGSQIHYIVTELSVELCSSDVDFREPVTGESGHEPVEYITHTIERVIRIVLPDSVL